MLLHTDSVLLFSISSRRLSLGHHILDFAFFKGFHLAGRLESNVDFVIVVGQHSMFAAAARKVKRAARTLACNLTRDVQREAHTRAFPHTCENCMLQASNNVFVCSVLRNHSFCPGVPFSGSSFADYVD